MGQDTSQKEWSKDPFHLPSSTPKLSTPEVATAARDTKSNMVRRSRNGQEAKQREEMKWGRGKHNEEGV